MNTTKSLDEIQVLLVEDSMAVSFQIKEFLANDPSARFNMEHVRDLTSAIDRLTRRGIRVILLDLGLPDSHGLSTFYRLHERFPDVPTIVFTGVNDEELALEALRQGAQDYLVKGQVDGRLLRRAIRYAIERKQAEESLRTSEEKHRTLLEAMPDIVYKIDPDGYIKYVNSAASRIGYHPDELIGKHFSVIVHPSDVGEVSRSSVLPQLEGVVTGDADAPKLLDERRSGDRLTTDLVLRLIPKDWKNANDSDCFIGSLTSYGEVTAAGHYQTNLATKEKKFAGTVGIIKDISERKRAEAEYAVLQERLQQSQKMEAIGRLAGGVAHDMNNVLGAILGSASVLDVETDANNSNREDIENILMACRKGRSLTRELLGFARKGKYVKESIPLNSVIEEVVSLLTRTIEKTIVVETFLDKNLKNVEGDHGQIHHALMNICINAADSINGQGRIAIVSKNISVPHLENETTSGLEPGEYIEITVSDTGSGMSKETLGKIFEPFFTTKPKGEGTGLGLSMVYGVIKNHGGAINVDSESDGGTTMSIRLPVFPHSDGKIEKHKSKRTSYKPDRGGILLVDDEHIIRNSAKRLLEKLGYKVFLAENGKTALEIYSKRKDQISLVLLDLLMPEMDGSETLEGLVSVNEDVKVLLLSGYSKDDKIDAMLNRGALGFIQKPFDLRTLSDVVKEAFA
ncbi:MAG: response regulator [Deltaproteobacteria bacterium]|nr:response regulator [Deltaproteobacteria bacterium]